MIKPNKKLKKSIDELAKQVQKLRKEKVFFSLVVFDMESSIFASNTKDRDLAIKVLQSVIEMEGQIPKNNVH